MFWGHALPLVIDICCCPGDVLALLQTPFILNAPMVCGLWSPPSQDQSKSMFIIFSSSKSNSNGIGVVTKEKSFYTLGSKFAWNPLFIWRLWPLTKDSLLQLRLNGQIQILSSLSLTPWIRRPSNRSNLSLASWKFQNLIRESTLKFGCNIRWWFILHIRQIGNETINVLTWVGANGSNFIEFISSFIVLSQLGSCIVGLCPFYFIYWKNFQKKINWVWPLVIQLMAKLNPLWPLDKNWRPKPKNWWDKALFCTNAFLALLFTHM